MQLAAKVLTQESYVFELGVNVQLVLLPDLVAQFCMEDLQQRGHCVVDAGGKGGHQPGVEGNEVHSNYGK